MTTKFMQFQGPNFKMLVPTNWFVTAAAGVQAAFVAPRASSSIKPNLTVSIRKPTQQATVQAVAEETFKRQQESYFQYKILEEKTWDQSAFQAFARRYSWYDRKAKQTVVQRQLFVLAAGLFFVLTSTQAAEESPDAEPIFITMMNSFKLE